MARNIHSVTIIREANEETLHGEYRDLTRHRYACVIPVIQCNIVIPEQHRSVEECSRLHDRSR